MVGSLLFLGVSPVVALVTSRFVRMSIGTRFVWVVEKRRVEFWELLEFQSTVSTTSAKSLWSLYQAMPLNPRWWGSSHQVWHQPESEPWSKSRKESFEDWSISAIISACILDCVCVLCGDFYSIPSFFMPHQTALAKPLAFCDLQVGDPNPHQLTPADLQRDEGAPTEDEVRSLIRLLVASERIEPSLFSSLKHTLGRVVANIGVCWYPSLVLLDFLGKYAIVTPFA